MDWLVLVASSLWAAWVLIALRARAGARRRGHRVGFSPRSCAPMSHVRIIEEHR